MTKNEGTVDRVVRVVAGLVILLLGGYTYDPGSNVKTSESAVVP